MEEDAPTDVTLVYGPTASGKSALALDLARAIDGTVINADAMQLYRELRILTARPTVADEAAAPHALYGTVSMRDAFSAPRWREAALAAIAAARAAGRAPILVGGTGLYFDALLRGLSPVPAVDAAIRARAQARHAALGAVAFHAELAARDPAAAARLAPGDTQRLIRAWEVVEATGQPLSAFQAAPRSGPPAGLRFRLIALLPPREQSYAAVETRFDRMLEAGVLDEVARVRALQLDPALPAMKAHGLRALLAHLDGSTPLEAAVAHAKKETRWYVKRQTTWFRHQVPSWPVMQQTLVEQQYSDLLRVELLRFVRSAR
jgi:tRNA dimethylallyltransferase